MRLWSLSPQYLDARGLVALWRETLLARMALRGQTRAYTAHPQLLRFKNSDDPLLSIEYYLNVIFRESVVRGYNFDPSKIIVVPQPCPIDVTCGQLEYEFGHLKRKLQLRCVAQYSQIANVDTIRPHPLFHVVDGAIETWERVNNRDQ